jgi:isoleucyl-tRNA synthetase
MTEMDRWILQKLNGVIERANEAYDDYEFHVPTFAIHQFCVNELSSFYLDSSKDRMYADGAESLSRRSGQTAMWLVLSAIIRMLAPVLSFTAEEVWQEMRKIDPKLPESIFLSDWPETFAVTEGKQLEEKWGKVLSVRAAVSRVLEQARSAGIIGHSLDARVEVERNGAPEAAALFTDEDLRVFSIVSGFRWVDTISDMAVVREDEETGLRIGVDKAGGEKCPRCWQYTEEGDENGLCPRCSAVLSA